MDEQCNLFQIDTKGRFNGDEAGSDDGNILFTIDTVGKYRLGSTLDSNDTEHNEECKTSGSFCQTQKIKPSKSDSEEDSDDDDDDSDEDGEVFIPEIQLPIPLRQAEESSKSARSKPSVEENINIDDCYLDIQLNKKHAQVDKNARKLISVDDLLKQKSTIVPGFEKLEAVPAYYESDRIRQKKQKKERERTKGSKWFNMPAPEMTDELKHDLEVIQMRSVLDPKHFYKKNDLKVLPKYFQVGRVVDSPADFYHSRIPKKQRKKTIVEELMADSEFKQYNKRRYKEIIEERRKTHYKAHIRAKKLKRKK